MLNQLHAATVADKYQKIRQLRDSTLEILLMPHQREILKMPQLMLPSLFLNYMLNSNTVSHVPFMLELLELEILKQEKLEKLQREL